MCLICTMNKNHDFYNFCYHFYFLYVILTLTKIMIFIIFVLCDQTHVLYVLLYTYLFWHECGLYIHKNHEFHNFCFVLTNIILLQNFCCSVTVGCLYFSLSLIKIMNFIIFVLQEEKLYFYNFCSVVCCLLVIGSLTKITNFLIFVLAKKKL